MTDKAQSLNINNRLDDEIVFKRIDPWMMPPEESECWVKNSKGEIIGYKTTRLMTREEIKEKYDVTISSE